MDTALNQTNLDQNSAGVPIDPPAVPSAPTPVPQTPAAQPIPQPTPKPATPPVAPLSRPTCACGRPRRKACRIFAP